MLTYNGIVGLYRVANSMTVSSPVHFSVTLSPYNSAGREVFTPYQSALLGVYCLSIVCRLSQPYDVDIAFFEFQDIIIVHRESRLNFNTDVPCRIFHTFPIEIFENYFNLTYSR